MATTLTNLETVRRVLRGVSGPQPLAGTAQRAADAYAAMMAAEWTESGDVPSVPPHHFDNASPMPGDAYRQTWGYDKSTRTERSACGAACYSVRIPADALSGEACGVASVSAKAFGDRYLECGAILTAFLSEDAVPPAWDAILADGVSTSAILVPAATDAHGDTIPPNKRADTSATATLPVGEPAAAWLHIVIRVADYLAVRDAWHEGGAMLDPSTVAVTFSRDVAEDIPSKGGYPLFWQAPTIEGLSIWSYDASAVFAIEVPNPEWATFAPASTTWTASAQQLRELMFGIRMPGAIYPQDTGGRELFYGHMVLPYGCNGWDHPAPSTVDGTIWTGYKLRTFTYPSSIYGGATLRLPVQHVASAIYPVAGVLPLKFNVLRAPAVAIGSHLSVRLLAYRVASRPPLASTAGYYGAEVSIFHQQYKPYPIPDHLDCENLLGGHGTSIAFHPSQGGGNDQPYPVYPSQPPSTLPYYPVPISLIGAWTITDNIAAGTQYRLTTPLEVDGYAGLMLLAVPCDYSRGGAPASTDNVYCDWPLSGWSLVK